MKIRYGNYSIYKKIEMQMIEDHYEYPRIDGQKLFTLNYSSDENDQLEGFFKHNLSGDYFMGFLSSEIQNAFCVVTKAIYKGHEFKVWAFNSMTRNFTIYEEDCDIGEKYNFIKLSDRYILDINLNDIEKLWEERMPTEYDMPMPKGLELYKEIEIPNNNQVGVGG